MRAFTYSSATDGHTVPTASSASRNPVGDPMGGRPGVLSPLVSVRPGITGPRDRDTSTPAHPVIDGVPRTDRGRIRRNG
jgi:hypothetical protein